MSWQGCLGRTTACRTRWRGPPPPCPRPLTLSSLPTLLCSTCCRNEACSACLACALAMCGRMCRVQRGVVCQDAHACSLFCALGNRQQACGCHTGARAMHVPTHAGSERQEDRQQGRPTSRSPSHFLIWWSSFTAASLGNDLQGVRQRAVRLANTGEPIKWPGAAPGAQDAVRSHCRQARTAHADGGVEQSSVVRPLVLNKGLGSALGRQPSHSLQPGPAVGAEEGA